ncbi:MAG TPA: PhoH family protein, partial [Nitrosomonas sp.]|nr:PhoH family protein [Nitrosomonas sp.]
NQITFCTGAAGTGKSHISVLKAIDMLFTGQVDKIFITTPVVEADEKLGFLPGGVDEKLDPYTYSTMYLFEKILPKRKVELLKERGAIKIMPLAYMRGINIDNAVVIAEEMQNCTPRQMKTFLTRIGSNAKFIISGDLEQQDRYHANQKNTNGLYDAMQKFSRAEYKDIGVFQFDNEDIVRNPLIAKILEQYKDV